MRAPINKTTQASVFMRDKWCCRYCGIEVLFSPALKALDLVNPKHGYYHSNGRADMMAKLLLDQCACIDHIIPVARGGTNEVENLVCACWKCNTEKSDMDSDSWRDKLIEKSRIKAANGWDGFLGLLESLDPENEWLKTFRNL